MLVDPMTITKMRRKVERRTTKSAGAREKARRDVAFVTTNYRWKPACGQPSSAPDRDDFPRDALASGCTAVAAAAIGAHPQYEESVNSATEGRARGCFVKKKRREVWANRD